jgi:predicted GNAT family acetyltransferase
MILQSPIDADIDTTEVRVLTRDDVDSMLELVALTEPGPFRGRTIEMGNYVGIVRDGALIAMAGERLQTHRFVEVSAVCTHPTVRGQGLASLLVTHVARGIQQRGKVPVLHVAEHNDAARRVYLRLGFEVRTRLAFVAAETPS